jgi:DMSO/TMAO reductase YedYZ molybdopterin-dependent catalytic subunit
MSDRPVLLRFEGAVERLLALGFNDLLGMPESSQVADVSRFQPTRKGDAVDLAALLELARPVAGVTHVTLHADRDDFHVSVPLDAIRDQGLVVYKVGNQGLATEQGGPIRLLIRDPTACHSGELDECANVKYLSRIELTLDRGRDTRPVDDAEHQALHDRQG